MRQQCSKHTRSFLVFCFPCYTLNLKNIYPLKIIIYLKSDLAEILISAFIFYFKEYINLTGQSKVQWLEYQLSAVSPGSILICYFLPVTIVF